MKSRFPLASIFFMVMTLGIIIILLRQANAIIPIGGAVLLIFAVIGALAAVVWTVLFAMRRAGVHRLAEAQTWPRQR